MGEEQWIEGLPFPMMYVVYASYQMESERGDGFVLHKTTGVPAMGPMEIGEVFRAAMESDAESLQFAGEGSRGAVINVLEIYLIKTLYRAE